MNRKNLILLSLVAVLAVCLIAWAIHMLYSGGSPGEGNQGKENVRIEEKFPLVKAVPSDAFAVFCVKDLQKAGDLFRDTATIFGGLVSEDLENFLGHAAKSFGKSRAIISLNYAKDLQPLLVIDIKKSLGDSLKTGALAEDAASCGMYCRIYEGLALISPSETVINSSTRHLGQGDSILEADGFSTLASKVSADNILFFSNRQADVIFKGFLSPSMGKYSGFFGRLSSWTAFPLERKSGGCTQTGLLLLYGCDNSFYPNVLLNAGKGSPEVAGVLPSNVEYVLDLPIGDIDSYLKAYRKYMDSRIRLDKMKAILSQQEDSTGTDAERYFKSLGVKEVAVAGVYLGKELKNILLIRPSNKNSVPEGKRAFPYKGFASTVFGDPFKGDSEEYCCGKKGWIIAGDEDVAEAFGQDGFLSETLSSYMGSVSLGGRVSPKDVNIFFYTSLGADPALTGSILGKRMASKMRASLRGADFAPACMNASVTDGMLSGTITIDRLSTAPGRLAPSGGPDTSVDVPQGPFMVHNCGTGQINTLYQNSHLSICLKDENGKDLWGIPFSDRIAGTVSEIDYYNNGKLQFLFGAGTKLYLLDRLGRFVGGFPVDLGKEIALGPSVHDFTGEHAYRALVLHKDNTVGLYNLHGETVTGWKGFECGETIKHLPELIENNGKKYWIARTSRRTMLFPFLGGGDLIGGDSGKMTRPDSPIRFNDKGAVIARCYDGKERTFKIE